MSTCVPYATNALNQYTKSGGTALEYDLRGNLTKSGADGYGYTSDDRLATAPNAGLAYDPLGRLFNVNTEAGVNVSLTYDGADAIAEIDHATGALLRRYVHGPGTDEPLVWYEGAGTADRRWLHADERGSVIAVSDAGGNASAINRYDEYGIPASGNRGRFQYTGQKWIAELGMYDYKARMYSPTLGRFMQTDPIGYADGLNWYDYVGGDPVNGVDPTGTETCAAPTGSHIVRCVSSDGSGGTPSFIAPGFSGVSTGGYWQANPAPSGTLPNGDVFVTAQTYTWVSTARFDFGTRGIFGDTPQTSQEEECVYKNASGQCVYDRDKNGKLQPTREQQQKICANFSALQDGATKTNDTLTTVGVGGAARGGVGGGIVGALSTLGAFISSITTGAGFRPFGLTIIPKSDPPAGCR